MLTKMPVTECVHYEPMGRCVAEVGAQLRMQTLFCLHGRRAYRKRATCVCVGKSLEFNVLRMGCTMLTAQRYQVHFEHYFELASVVSALSMAFVWREPVCREPLRFYIVSVVNSWWTCKISNYYQNSFVHNYMWKLKHCK